MVNGKIMDIEDWEPSHKPKNHPAEQKAGEQNPTIAPQAHSPHGQAMLDDLDAEAFADIDRPIEATPLAEQKPPKGTCASAQDDAMPSSMDEESSSFQPFKFIMQKKSCAADDCSSCQDKPPIAAVSKARSKFNFIGVGVGLLVLMVVLLQVYQNFESKKISATINAFNGLMPDTQTVALTNAQTPCGQPVAMGMATTPCGQPVAFGMGGVLTPAEKRFLIYMREEEKLARDVYLNLYDRWKVAIFRSISRSEQRHMDAVLRMITRYGLEDPAAQDVRGQFKDRDLRELYEKLIARGERSLGEALKVGGLVEELDIFDLNRALRETSAQDITRVYQNIQRGSFNHLRSFAHGVELRGQRYKAQKLSQQQVDTILHAPMDTNIGLLP
ncbi:conserved hypothetical protein [Magnetococcus marinus MC-1]|uniref:DUF2202 domain-containing protein n=2 Tax=Magnetococcus TaxID=162171 RepID=A0L9X2_MAGMM|nr:conserved hypothetical protein [Magnetococcus marinus MC-1]